MPVLNRSACLQTLQAKYTFGAAFRANAYQIDVLRFSLPRKLAGCFPGIVEEIQQAFEDNISLEGNGAIIVHDTSPPLPSLIIVFGRLEVLPCHDLDQVGRKSSDQPASDWPPIL